LGPVIRHLNAKILQIVANGERMRQTCLRSWSRPERTLPMTEVDAIAEPVRGTAAHYMFFLDWAEKKGELPASTIQNWRNASGKVLEIEDDWRDVNVAEFDLDAHIARFETLRRTAYTSSSMAAYKSRAKVGIETYRAWLSQSPDWKPKASGSTRSARNGSKKTAVPLPAPPASEQKGETGGFVPHHATLIEYPFPLRPGLRALLALPEDLSEKEAKRVARFVESLAFAEQPATKTSEVAE
jgi:hypothetical protein